MGGFGTTRSPTATPTLTPTSNPSQNPTATPTSIPSASPSSMPIVTGMIYRVSNNVLTGWRPGVAEVHVYSDSTCTTEIDATFEGASGGYSRDTDGSKAFDGSDGTSWRPQCHPCAIGEAWLSFSVSEEIKCVEASNLGEDRFGPKTWNGGIKVEKQNSDGTWTTEMESTNGNSASKLEDCQSSFLSYDGKCYGTVDWNLQPEPVRFNTPVSSSPDNCDIEEWHEIPDGCQLAPATSGITGDVVGKFEFGTYLLILSNGGAYKNPTYGAGAGQRLKNHNFLQMGPTNRHYKTKCCGCKLLLQCDLGFGIETSSPTANPTVEPTATPTVNPTEGCFDTPSWSNGWNGCEIFAEKNLCAKYGHRDWGKGKANDHCCVCGGGRTEPNTDPYVWRGDYTGNCAQGSTPIRTKDECEAAARFFSESDRSATAWRYPHQSIPSGCWVYLNKLYFNNDPNQWNWTGNNGYIKTFCKAEGSTQSTSTTCTCTGLGTECQDVMDRGDITTRESCEAYQLSRHGGNHCTWSCDSGNSRRSLTGRLAELMSSRAGN